MNGPNGQVLYQPDDTVLTAVVAEVQGCRKTSGLVLVPTVAQLRELVATTFWASLERNEGRSVFPQVVLVDATVVGYKFAQAVPFDAAQLAWYSLTLSPNRGLAVTALPESSEPTIAGVALMEFNALAIRAIAPGVLVLSVGQPMALLRGAHADLLDRGLKEKARELMQGVGAPGEGGDRRARNVLLRLAQAVRRLNHGGVVLIVPKDSTDWKGTADGGRGGAREPYEGLARAVRRSHETRQRQDSIDRDGPIAPEELRFILSGSSSEANQLVQFAIDEVAALANVDGAIVLDSALNVLGFGAKIGVHLEPFQVRVLEPTQGSTVRLVAVDQIGGMRHQSAASFVRNTEGSSAIVASQDGCISVFGREAGEVTQIKGLEVLLP